MGCFLGCFGSSKDEKRRKSTHNAPPKIQNFGNQYYQPVQTQQVPTVPVKKASPEKPINFVPQVKQDSPENPINLIPQSRAKPEKEELSLNNQSLNDQVKLEEQLSSGARKKVTFDSNVKEYEPIPVDDEAPVNVESTRSSDKVGEKGVNENSTTPSHSHSLSVPESGSTVSSLGSYPPNHRYQNCRESDDEDEELHCEVSDLDEDEDDENDDDDGEESYDDEYYDDDYHHHQRHVQEFSTGSFTSMESTTKCPPTGDPVLDLSPEIAAKTLGFNCGARDRAGYVHSVLNPVENTTQWKAVKGKGTTPLKQQKENLQMDPSIKQFTWKSKPKLDEPKNNHEVAVDASLSNWLVSSQKTPPPNKATSVGLQRISSGASLSSYGSNSVRSQEERPILGALTVEELKKFSSSSSPRRSPSLSPDEKPLVGTVGVHWNDRTPTEDSGSASSFKGIPNTTSKYREDKKVNWHSTPFETRLERALNRGAA